MKKATIIIVLLFALLLAVPSLDEKAGVVNAAEKMKTVKDIAKYNFKKNIQGGLTKIQIEDIFESLTFFSDIKKKKTLTTADFNGRLAEKYKKPDIPFHLSIFHMKNYNENSMTEVYRLTDVNRALSFFTNLKYEKNKTYADGFYSDDNNLYFGQIGYGWEELCKIRTIKYNSTIMKINYDQIPSTGTSVQIVGGRYTATLKKQSNKKYKLIKIQVRKPTTKEKALDACKKKILWFMNKKMDGYYLVTDYDGDGIKELLVKYRSNSNSSGRPVAIYKYKKGKLKKIFVRSPYIERITTFKKGKVLLMYTCSHGEQIYEYFKLSKKGKYKKIASKMREARIAGGIDSPWNYYVKGKKVKKYKYKKEVKKMTKGKRKVYKIYKWKSWDRY